jgi:hypothetical protein
MFIILTIWNIIDPPPLGGFGEILAELMIFPKGLCPKGNYIITEGNI